MAKRKPTTKRKPPPRKAPPKDEEGNETEFQEDPNVQVVDEHGLVYLGDSVEVTCSVNAKISINYHSVGIEKGIRFKTPREHASSAVEKATLKLRTAIKGEIDNMKKLMDDVQDQ